MMADPLSALFSPDVVRAVTEVTGKIRSVDHEGRYWRIFTHDDSEYMMFKDEGSARSFTIDHVREDIRTEPEMFDHGWLLTFIDQQGVRDDLNDDVTDIDLLDDPVQYLKDVGYYGENLTSILGTHLDLGRASRDVVDRDGSAYFLVGDGGVEFKVRTGHVLFKVD